jgi:hypothetical protein
MSTLITAFSDPEEAPSHFNSPENGAKGNPTGKACVCYGASGSIVKVFPPR